MNPISTRNIWRLTWPTIVVNISHMLLAIGFLKIAGDISSDAVAAMTTGQRLYFILQSVFMGLCSGTTAMVGRYWGAGDLVNAGRFAAVSLILVCLIALLITWPMIPFRLFFIDLFELTPQAREMSNDYLFWVAITAPVMAAMIVFNVMFRAIGDTKTPLWFGLTLITLSVTFSIPLAYGLMGLPALQISGIAIGQGLGILVALIAFLFWWVKGKMRFSPTNPKPGFIENSKKLIAIGYPTSIEQTAGQFGLIIVLIFISTYGNTPYAAFGIGFAVMNLMVIVAYSFSMSSATLVSQNLGAGDKAKAYNAGWNTMRTSVYMMLLAGITMSALAHPIANFMIGDEDVVSYIVIYLYMLSLTLPFMAITFSLSGALHGAGETRFPMRVTTVSIIMTRILLPVTATWLEANVIWLFASLPLDYLFKASLLIHRYRRRKWLSVLS